MDVLSVARTAKDDFFRITFRINNQLYNTHATLTFNVHDEVDGDDLRTICFNSFNTGKAYKLH